MKGDIYRGADVVNVWLGEEDERTASAISYIQHLLDAFPNPDERDEAGDEVPRVVQTLGILTLKCGGWMAFREMLERLYFRRMWIVQEVALGKKVVVFCGSHSVTWNELAKAALCLETDDGHQHEAHRVVRSISGMKRRGKWSLVELLDQSFNLFCTNPQDKIYGILSVPSNGSLC